MAVALLHDENFSAAPHLLCLSTSHTRLLHAATACQTLIRRPVQSWRCCWSLMCPASDQLLCRGLSQTLCGCIRLFAHRDSVTACCNNSTHVRVVRSLDRSACAMQCVRRARGLGHLGVQISPFVKSPGSHSSLACCYSCRNKRASAGSSDAIVRCPGFEVHT